MKVKNYIYILLCMGEFWAMAEKQENTPPLPTPVTQMSQRSLDEIQKVYPHAESVLRASTLQDLPATVKILDIMNTSKEEILIILEKLEGEMYQKAGLEAPIRTPYNTCDNIVETSALVASYLQYIDQTSHPETQPYTMYALYIALLNLQYYYGEKRAQYHIHFVASYVFNQDGSFSWGQNTPVTLNDNDMNKELSHQKNIALLDTGYKKHVARIFHFGDFNYAWNQDIVQKYSAKGTFPKDVTYAKYLDNLTLFFDDCDAIERYTPPKTQGV